MPKSRPRHTAADREARRIRIVAAIRNGVGYDEIGRRETIGHERVPEIAFETMRLNDGFARDPRFLQAARFDPALKLAVEKINAGKFEAVGRLVKALDRVDKYLARARPGPDKPDIPEPLIRRVERRAREPEIPEIWATPGVHPQPRPRNLLKAKQTALG